MSRLFHIVAAGVLAAAAAASLLGLATAAPGGKAESADHPIQCHKTLCVMAIF